MTFPYSHMSRDELIQRAELEGDALSRALAAQLKDAEDDVEGARKEAEDEGERKREAEADRDATQAILDTHKDAIATALDLIPVNTQHRGLRATRNALGRLE